jgi:hypothetical protein
LEKLQAIDRLTVEIKRLKDKLRHQERTAKEEPFGASTPSSKRLVKAASTDEARAKRGGARPGHEGHGRVSASEGTADTVEALPAPAACPDCGCVLEDWGARERTVYDCEPVRRRTRLVLVGEGRCPACGKTHRSRLPGVLPRSALSNRLLAQAAKWHDGDGLTMGHVARQFGVSGGTLFGRMRTLADICRPASDRLVEQYRAAPVKHADETGWRCDGANGYAWGFFTPDTSIFRCRGTRSGDEDFRAAFTAMLNAPETARLPALASGRPYGYSMLVYWQVWPYENHPKARRQGNPAECSRTSECVKNKRPKASKTING